MSGLISSDQFLDAAGYRHTLYALTDDSPISAERIEEVVRKVLHVTPTVYNSQLTRITLVFGDAHKKIWDLIANMAKPILISSGGEAVWQQMEGRFQAFRAAYGTAIFWEDEEALDEWKQKRPSQVKILDQFSEHHNAMHQIHLWTALELEGLGANLQHYQALPGVTDALHKALELPGRYSLKAQMVFGGKAEPHPEAKEKFPFSKTLKVVS